jgi:hypothetical protein
MNIKHEKELRNTKNFIIFIMIFVLVLAVFPIYTYWGSFGDRDRSTNPEQWGQLGDYIGGLLNPIIAFATLISVLYAIFLQKQELGETKSALVNQSILMDEQIFDSKFFNLLSLFNQSVETMRITIDGRVFSGFEAIKESLHEFIIKSSDLAPHHEDGKTLSSDIIVLLAGYQNYYLGSTTIFMTIQRILSIEESISNSLIRDKKYYHRLFTVFLSDEIKIWLYIFYTFTKKQGEIIGDYGCLSMFLGYFGSDLSTRLDIPHKDLNKVCVAIQYLVNDHNKQQ